MLLSGNTISSSDSVSLDDIASSSDSRFNLIEALENFHMDWLSPVQLICLIAFVFIIIMIALEFLRSRYALSITREIVTLDSLPETFDGTKIAVISDLHQMRFGECNAELAKRIKREEPDYIFFVGDMGDSRKYNVDAFYDLLESLGDKIPIITVPGNHDLRLGGGTLHKNFVREVERSGAVILSNTSAEMVSGGKKLYIYGFCQPLAQDAEHPAVEWKFADVSDEDVASLLGSRPADAPVILLAHNPEPFESYRAWGADLVLAGHLHGGGIRLPFIGGLLGQNNEFLPKHTAGLFREGDTQMFVTRGLGSTVPRFLNPPEIAILTLTCPGSPLIDQPAPPLIAMPSFTLEKEPETVQEKYTPSSKNTKQLPESKEKEKNSSGGSSDKNKSSAANASGNPLAAAGQWLRSEWNSLRELLNERFNQISDFFALMFGKKRSKFSRIADERKKRSTYVAPSNKKKKPKNRYRK